MSHSALSAPVVVLAFLASAGCSGEPLVSGFDEPLRIPDGQFHAGKLPGSPPLTADEINDGVQPKSPTVVGVNLGNALIPPREPGRSVSGLATPDSVALGVRFKDLGSGYWIVPTRSPDTTAGGSLEWRFRAAFAEGLPPGRHELLLAAVDESGQSGHQVGLTLCLLPEIPDNGNACNPAITDPPATVVSLDWDAPVDLDLRVVTPSGKVVTPKHPTTAEEDADGKADATAEGVGRLDHDSFANCRADGQQRENLVFQTHPPRGTYLVYAGLFDACGEAGVSFTVSIHTAVRRESGEGKEPRETYRQSGQLRSIDADGGARLGTYITSFNVK
jgi:hypothetical protein